MRVTTTPAARAVKVDDFAVGVGELLDFFALFLQLRNAVFVQKIRAIASLHFCNLAVNLLEL